MYGSVADQVYTELANHNPPPAIPEEVEDPNAPDPTTLFEAARAKFFQDGQKVFGFNKKKIVSFFFLPLTVLLCLTFVHILVQVLAEQHVGRKTAPSESERDRSPIRGNRAPLLPDPVPGSFAQSRPKRRALLPTPPGVPPEEAATAAAAATTAPEGSDPLSRYLYIFFLFL